jgi:hypothetical protein
MAFSWRSWRAGDARRTFAETFVLRVDATHGIVDGDIRVGGLIVAIEKLTTSLQLVGAALAVPAGIAGVYSAYHNYFSPEVRCQEMRNTTLVTLEKNIPTEAKRALLRTDVAQFQAKCGEVEPETAMVFQVALQELDKPAPAPKAAQKPGAQPRPPAALAAAATTPAGPAAPPSAMASPPASATPAWPATAAPVAAAAPPAPVAAAPAAVQPAAPAVQPAAPARPNLAPGPAVASLGPMARFIRPVRGWVAIEVRKPGKVTEVFFSGYPADGQSLPPPGTVLTAMAFRPIWLEPQGQGPIDPTKLQGRIKVGECVRVLTTAASLGRQWAEVEPAACP